MRAWQVHSLGDPADVLRLDDLPVPDPGPGEVRIEVEAVALNFPDVLLCQGKYQERPPLPFTPGLEVAGHVVAAGEGSTYAVGQRVLASPPLPRGGLAEQVLAPAEAAFAIPDSLSATKAAAMFITYQTGWAGLHRRAAIRPGETLLVHAGAGGVGSAAIQLGLAAGARVIATAGGPEKVEICRTLGAELAIDYLAEDFVDVVKGATGGRGADVIYDSVGGDTFDRSRKCIAFEGRLVVVGFAGGRIAEAPTNHALVKNYSIVGLHWGLYRQMEPTLIPAIHDELMALHARGAIDPLIFAELPLEDAPAALAKLGGRATWGKVVLRP
ncbi:MAG TPA: NADPH:quinone oxidoreductase family protein [Mycobacteriales bacterium]|nr:NADPH:quinone oxidoreductase family protein [Mycobacteriales bacterium]